MSTQEPGRAQPGLTPLPRIEDLPGAADGYDRAKVQDAFDSFRRHVTSLQANLRVLQAAPKSAISEPSGHAVRMDALHIVRAAAEFADTIERDAQDAAATQVGRAEREIREKQMELQQQEAEIARIRQETERQRTEILSAARKESREILTKANRDATAELREAEARGNRLTEQSRHQATELTNSARAEVEQTLDWARAQAELIVQRARMGAEQLLSAAGHGDAAIHEAVDAIVKAAEATVDAQRGGQSPAPPLAGPDAVTAESVEPEPADEPVPAEPHDEPSPAPEALEPPAETEDSTEDGGPSEDESPAPS
jgi:F0F1-type ATP synthase membrane subunit b/b'